MPSEANIEHEFYDLIRPHLQEIVVELKRRGYGMEMQWSYTVTLTHLSGTTWSGSTTDSGVRWPVPQEAVSQ
jgi:hypothetical protein